MHGFPAGAAPTGVVRLANEKPILAVTVRSPRTTRPASTIYSVMWLLVSLDTSSSALAVPFMFPSPNTTRKQRPCTRWLRSPARHGRAASVLPWAPPSSTAKRMQRIQPMAATTRKNRTRVGTVGTPSWSSQSSPYRGAALSPSRRLQRDVIHDRSGADTRKNRPRVSSTAA